MTFADFAARLAGLLSIEVPSPPHPSVGLFDDLAFDSIQAFELIIVVEALAENLLPPETVPEIYTLGDAFAYYEDLRAAELADQ